MAWFRFPKEFKLLKNNSEVKKGLPAMLKGGVRSLENPVFVCWCHVSLKDQLFGDQGMLILQFPKDFLRQPLWHCFVFEGYHGRDEQRTSEDCWRGWCLRSDGSWAHLGSMWDILTFAIVSTYLRFRWFKDSLNLFFVWGIPADIRQSKAPKQ